ncbi:MAG TPA: alpha/beta fold hydrolase [Vicinamibacterales bacterium]|nr:alpha/beta fold hydrolase [Vicinamibacterales bacterium]
MVHEHRAELGDRSIRYLESGAGWPLILLHAFPLQAAMWTPQLERVPRGWRLIAPDIRGFGGTAAADGARPSMEDYAADLIGLLDALELDRAVIGGLSMGGYITFAMLRLAPERFSGVVLADTRAQADTPEGRDNRRTLSELVRTRGPAAVADQMMPKLLGRTTRESRPEVKQEVRRLILSNDAAGIDGAIHAMLQRPDSTAGLGRISVPTLVVTGDEDTLVPVADAEALQRAIPRSQFVVLPRAGHLSSLESPDDFSEALRNFLLSNL